MVDEGEVVFSTLKREFMEEALNSLEMNSTELAKYEKIIGQWMSPEAAVIIHKGVVANDYRNTDNSWMETVVAQFHDEPGTTLAKLNLVAGDDAGDVMWMDLSRDMNLFVDHRQFLSLVAERMNCHW